MKLLTLLLLFFLCSAASAQTTLQPGTPVEREIDAGQLHNFTVKLEENNFIQLVVEQRGVDVIVKVFSPAGKSLGEFDTPNGGEGPEHVSFVAVTAGSYSITVGPLDGQTMMKGKYVIKILEVREATEQELKTSKNLEATKAKGIALLADIEAIIPQIKSPLNRVKAQLQTAQLLWDIDQKRASKLFADATSGFKEFLAAADPDYFFFSGATAVQLRHEIIQALAVRDPDAALSFLHSTSQMIASAFDQSYHFSQESALELAIVEQVMRNNPKRALQMARQSLKQGYSPHLINTLSQLRRQNPEMAAELANEVVGKLLNEKLLKLPEAAHVAANLLSSLRSSEIRPESTNGATPAAFLTDERLKELVQKVFDEALAYSGSPQQSHEPGRDAAWAMLHALKSFGQLDTIISGGNAAVDKKLAELNDSFNPRLGGSYANVFGGNPAELSPEVIAKMPVEVREQAYLSLSMHKGNSGDVARARQLIDERITNPSMRRHALTQLDQIEMHQALNKGKVDEVIRILNGFRNVRERAQQLAQIANRIGAGLKRATMISLLEQARTLLSPTVQAQDQDQMFALLEIGRAFSRYDVKRSFEVIDPLVEQFNALTMAARTLDGFGANYYEGEELDLQNSNPLANVALQMSSVLGNLAVINFDRAKTTAERIQAPEVRLRIYLEIAQQTIKAAN